jgi:hypothetical protein
VAGAHGEDAPDDPQRLAQRGDIGVGPEEAGAGQRHPAHHQHPRKRLCQRHGDARIALVVGEPDVEARLVLLDEVVLEQEGLRLARHDDRLQVGDLPDQGGPLGRVAGIGTDVAGHAGAQVLRFAHVQDLACRAFPEIHARLVGECV